MKRIAVFVSGGGSNLQSLINACKKGEINGKIVAVISSKQSAYALKRAKRADIAGYVYEKSKYPDTESMFGDISRLLNTLKIDLIVLAGYMLVLSPNIIKQYENRIINIHPSLIPAFCGKGFYGLRVHQAVLDYGCKVTGATVHFVDEGTDTGAIILQKVVAVKENDTPEILQKRVLKTEHRLLPIAVKLYCNDCIKVKDRITHIKEK